MQQNKMTRKQALACFDKQFGVLGSGPKWIDFFIETGMLQVEEEKTTEQKVIEFCHHYDYSVDLIKYLDANELKIVEK